MRSAFFGINIAQQGLFTAQTNLNITSHNIANAETEGFSRQYGVQSATTPLRNGNRGMQGTGSEITNVLQHRNSYLDNKYRNVNNELGEFKVKSELLKQMEIVLNEPSDSGYSSYFNNIFKSLNDLAKDASGTAQRSAFVDSINALGQYFNDVGKQLAKIQEDANFGIKTSVDRINHHAQQLASLNLQISNLELSGSRANDLRDERNRLIDSLNELVNVEAEEITDQNGKKSYKVAIEGQVLVNDATANYLEVRTRKTLDNPEDGLDMYDVYWKSGSELSLNRATISGQLKGYIEIRDGNNGENFKGTVKSGAGTTSVVIENPSRTDLPPTGKILIGGKPMRYNAYTYNATTKEMTFQFGPPAGMVGKAAKGTDTVGDDFTGTVTAATSSSVTLSNPGNKDLDPLGGVVYLDGVAVTYTGYTKNPDNSLTLTTQVPAGANTQPAAIGEDVKFKGVPYYLGQLNTFTRTFARKFNEVNESGNGGSGVPLFTFKGYSGPADLSTADLRSYEKINVHNFTVNQAVLDDIRKVENTANAGGGESANDLIKKLVDLRQDETMFAKGKPENYLQAVIGELGIDTKQTASMEKGQENMATLIKNQRKSVSGVDVNEESTNLLKFQRAYQVAAKIISIMDNIYDTTINRMGV